MTEFFQEAPEIKNQYLDDPILQACLKWLLPQDVNKKIKTHLEHLGERACGDLLKLSRDAESNPPQHIPFDPWGNRIDEIKVCPAWDELAKAAAEEGIVASGYERKYGQDSRVYQAALLYLYHPSSAFFSCPLAMTDGAAKAMELYGEGELKKKVLSHLTSRDPKKFWTSGQWMTEKTGGSDVSGTSTIAKKKGKQYELFGTKWFTSATTSQMAMLLAKTEKGLSLFYTELRDEKNKLDQIQIHRLKDKLGTKALPTAELKLEGTTGIMVGMEGKGVKNIASLFNITRLYNSICAVGTLRRAFALAKDYSHKRQAFGKKLIDQPLHLRTLQELEADLAGSLFFTFYVMGLQGKDDLKKITEEEKRLLRMLTPILKLYTGKKTMSGVSEAMECIGGAAYIEDTGLPTLLRDAQVFSIWEGTTNVLSLDVLRSMEKDQSFPAYMQDVNEKLKKIKEKSELKIWVELKIEEAQKMLKAWGKSSELFQANARRWSFLLAEIYIAVLFLDFKSKVKDKHVDQLIKFWLDARL